MSDGLRLFLIWLLVTILFGVGVFLMQMFVVKECMAMLEVVSASYILSVLYIILEVIGTSVEP